MLAYEKNKEGIKGLVEGIEGREGGEEKGEGKESEDVSLCIIVTLDDAKNACYAQSIPICSLLMKKAGYSIKK